MGSGDSEMVEALTRLRDRLADPPFPLQVPGADTARRICREVAGQVDDYALPRLADPAAPLLAVVGGSTGSGKSTLVNALARRRVSAAGVLRPTTRSPVLICGADDEPWFTGRRVLPSLQRAHGEVTAASDDRMLHLVRCSTLPRALAIIDAPDFDSVVETNRELAVQLLGAADLWLFVTTAARYADAVPWSFLRQARDRGVAVAVVVDRCPEDGRQEASEHFAQLLDARDLGDAPFIVLPEVDGDTLPDEAVVPLRDWLAHIAADQEARENLVQNTLAGMLDSFDERLVPAIRAGERQDEAVQRLRAVVDDAYLTAGQGVDNAVLDGSLVKGDVLARWRALVGSGELVGVQHAASAGGSEQVRELRQALADSVCAVVVAHAEQAVEQVTAQWSADAAGAALLDEHQALRATSDDLADQLRRRVGEWQERSAGLAYEACTAGSGQVPSWDDQLLGLMIMLVALIPVGAAAGTEVAVARSATRASRRLLETIFEGETVRRWTASVRRELQGETHAVLEREAARYAELLQEPHVPRDSADRVREVLFDLQAARQ